jgi:DNA-binding Lrp family transcriptional regulator
VVVEAWRRSGERQAEFAERYGIHPARLSRRAERLQEDAAAVRFHPVRLIEGEQGQRSRGEPIEIVLGGSCSARS